MSKRTAPKEAQPKTETAAAAARYIANTGIDSAGVRYERGDVVPAELVARASWLLEQGHVSAQEVQQ